MKIVKLVPRFIFWLPLFFLFFICFAHEEEFRNDPLLAAYQLLIIAGMSDVFYTMVVYNTANSFATQQQWLLVGPTLYLLLGLVPFAISSYRRRYLRNPER